MLFSDGIRDSFVADVDLDQGKGIMKHLERWLPLLVIGTGMIAYANSFSNPFTFDDNCAIRNSSSIYHFLPLSLVSRFIVRLSFKLNDALSGPNVADYHAVNLLIHILAGLLFYGIVRRTLLLPSLSSRYGKVAPWIAVICSVIWVVHPLQTESVTYICQRYESMMGMFFLLSLYCFVRAKESVHKRFWYDATLAACAVGMGTKEVMATAPVVMLLYDYVFVSGSFRQLLKARWRVYAALFGTWGILVFLCLGSVSENMKIGSPLFSRMSPVAYLFTQFGVITHYLRLAVFPYPLCLDYAWRAAEGLWKILLPGIFIGALGIGMLWALYRRSPIGFLGTCFFIILAPTSSIIPIADAAFEHRMYLPLASVGLICVTCTYHLLEHSFHLANVSTRGQMFCRIIIPVIITVTFLGLTIDRNRDYRSELSMWRDVVRKRPNNLGAHNNLAVALFEIGEFEEGLTHINYVLERTKHVRPFHGTGPVALPSNSDESNRRRALANLGLLLSIQGRNNDAIAHYTEALRISPYSADIVSKLKRAMLASGGDPDLVNEEIRRRPWCD